MKDMRNQDNRVNQLIMNPSLNNSNIDDNNSKKYINNE